MKLNVLKPIPFILLCLVACKKPADKAYERLAEAAENGQFLYGHQDDLVYGHAWKVEDPAGDKLDRSDVKSVCGQYPAIVGFDLGGIEMADSANLDGVDFGLMRRAAKAHAKRGGLVTFSWHPRNPVTGSDSWDVSDSTVVASVLEGGANYDTFQTWLSRAADFLQSLGNIPIIFRPWHENIGSWFWWGGALCSADEYKALYKMTYDYLASKGLDNLIWVYSPDSNASEEQYFERYPGDEYVDILGVDHYQYGGQFSNVFYMNRLQEELRFMDKYAAAHGKLICLSETGYEGIKDAKWWTGTLLEGLKGMPVAYVLTWRNAWDKPTHYYAPFEGSEDAPDFCEFASNERTVFLK